MNTLLLIVLCSLLIPAACYLFMIMPRMAEKPDMEPLKKWLYAHRGLHDNGTDAPENSIKAFRRALNAGFGIEMDVQLTRDKIPVVFHDFTLDRVCGAEGRVCDYTYQELQQFSLCKSQERIPRFGDVLEMVQGKVPLIIELKIERVDMSACAIVDELLSGYKGLYCIESFNPLGLYWYRRNRGRVIRGQLSDVFLKTEMYKSSRGAERVLYFVLQNLMLNFLGRPDFIAYNHKYADKLSRRLCRGIFRSTAAAWTVKSEEELAAAGKHFDIFIFDSFIPKR